MYFLQMNLVRNQDFGKGEVVIWTQFYKAPNVKCVFKREAPDCLAIAVIFCKKRQSDDTSHTFYCFHTFVLFGFQAI